MMKTSDMRKLGIYIHIPFCSSKCRYCAFMSFAENSSAAESPYIYGTDGSARKRYIDLLNMEIDNYNEQYRSYEVDSVFIGGGTPSILETEQMLSIIDAVKRSFSLSEDCEITMESNPGTLDFEKLKYLHESGINRLSIGVQSLDDKILKTLGRTHTAYEAAETFKAARNAGFNNINIDLMFGVPGHTETSWNSTIDRIIELGPEHISFYSLQLEEKTPFYDMYKNNEMDLVDAESERRMYHEAIHRFADAGYEHYEISNCAKSGFLCRHNMKYWSYEEYLGIGLGAHSYIRTGRCSDGSPDERGSRFSNYEDMEAYAALVMDGQWPIDMSKYQTDSLKDGMSIFVFTALRKRSGLDLAEFRKQFGRDFFEVYKEKADVIAEYKSAGLIGCGSNRLYLTEKGIDASNDIMSEFV